jgi:hypothetical protein
MERTPLIVFSHLPWDFVYRRPQRLMTRLAQRRPVLFVEAPVYGERARLELEMVAERVRVCRPQLPIRGQAFGPAQEEVLTELLQGQRDREGWDEFAAWLYTPMPVRIARALHARAFVYDCMDELSAFVGASKELIDRERELMGIADVVLTGGPSLYRSKRSKHPSSVRDVIEPYGDIVYAGDGPRGFVDAGVRALEDSDAEREARRSRAVEALRRTSWDETARRMDEILRQVADSGQSRTLLTAAAAAVGAGAAAGK